MKIAALIALCLCLPGLAQAQQAGCLNSTTCVQLNTFVPSGAATLATSTVSSRVAFPSTGSSLSLLVTNTGTVAVYVAAGGVTVTAATSGTVIGAGQSISIAQGSNGYIAGITATGAAVLNIQSGTGVPIIVYGQLSTILTPAENPSTPAASAVSAIVTGGVAINIVTGPVTGCYVVNPLTAADQNIATAEVAYLNPVTVATAAGRGTNSALQPGQGFNCTPGMVTNISAIAATAGHAFTVVVW